MCGTTSFQKWAEYQKKEYIGNLKNKHLSRPSSVTIHLQIDSFISMCALSRVDMVVYSLFCEVFLVLHSDKHCTW